MRMLMPSHARNVKLHREPTPIFAEAGVEAQLDAMFSTQVTLKSGVISSSTRPRLLSPLT